MTEYRITKKNLSYWMDILRLDNKSFQQKYVGNYWLITIPEKFPGVDRNNKRNLENYIISTIKNGSILQQNNRYQIKQDNKPQLQFRETSQYQHNNTVFTHLTLETSNTNHSIEKEKAEKVFKPNYVFFES